MPEPVMGQRLARALDDERSIEVRYERARRELVPRFLERHRLTQAGLADLLGVDKTSLSRFVNCVEGYTPSRTRPGKLEILEKIEARCGKLNIFHELEQQAQTPSRGPDFDEQVWFDNFVERLKYLEEKYAPATALAMLPELCAQAMNAPPPFAASMASNLLLIPICGHVDRPEMADASEELLRHTVARIKKLESFALHQASVSFRKSYLHAPIGYAGFALSMIAIRLGDDALLGDGIERLLKAAFMPHEPEDYHWPNLLAVLERSFETGNHAAATWSDRVAREAQRTWSELLRHAHTTRLFANVRAHWSAIAPELMERIDGRHGEHHADA